MICDLEFIGEDILRNMVEKVIDGRAELTSVTNIPFPVGENFNGELMRIKIGYRIKNSSEERELSVIAKYLPDDQFLIKFAEDMKSFKREMFMYKYTLSDMYSFGYLNLIAPKPYFVSEDPKPTLLLEDLCSLNYRMLPRNLGLDLEHCMYVLERLACFHATSVALFEKDPNSMEIYDQTLFADIDGMRDVLIKGFHELLQTCKRLPELNKYHGKLQVLEKGLVNTVLESSKLSAKFNVLNHGDLWNNNMMFCYHEDGQIKNVRFLDYQGLHFTSPAIDLHFFLAVAANPQAKISTEKLIKHYFQNLIYYLRELKVKVEPPTWDDFFEDYRSRSFHGIAAACVLLALSRAGDRTDSSIVNFINSEGEDGFRYHAFNNERYVREIKILLPMYDGYGAFN